MERILNIATKWFTTKQTDMYRNYIKRILDFIISLIGFIFISPVFVVVWIWLSIANKGAGAFFFQPRPGKDERIFKVIKFKTMTDEKDANGKLLPDAQRLTKVGRFVRSTSLDEIPQLLNVIKGDMSLIGPRPLRVHYLPLYNESQKKRHNVKPGITGLAQVNGRNNISWTKKFEYDIYYVDHLSFILDVKIVLLTIKKTVIREGINKEGEVTTTPFNGFN